MINQRLASVTRRRFISCFATKLLIYIAMNQFYSHVRCVIFFAQIWWIALLGCECWSNYYFCYWGAMFLNKYHWENGCIFGRPVLGKCQIGNKKRMSMSEMVTLVCYHHQSKTFLIFKEISIILHLGAPAIETFLIIKKILAYHIFLISHN